MADLDSARRHLLAPWERAESGGVVHVGGRGVTRGPFLHDRADSLGIIEIDVGGRRRELEEILVAENLALAGGGENDELVAEIAADGPGVGAHGNRLQPEPRERAQVGDEHARVGMLRARLVEVEGIGVLHEEFARAHDAEARAHLVAELPLDVIEIERQVLVGANVGAEDFRHHLLVGRTEEHFALVTILDAQHLLAVIVVAPALAPQVRRLDRGHEHFDRAGAILLFADDAVDLVEHAQADRQPRVDARRFLPQHSGAQHQPVRDDFRLFRGFSQNGQEIPGETHRETT